jgi:hypothetical protein
MHPEQPSRSLCTSRLSSYNLGRRRGSQLADILAALRSVRLIRSSVVKPVWQPGCSVVEGRVCIAAVLSAAVLLTPGANRDGEGCARRAFLHSTVDKVAIWYATLICGCLNVRAATSRRLAGQLLPRVVRVQQRMQRPALCDEAH